MRPPTSSALALDSSAPKSVASSLAVSRPPTTKIHTSIWNNMPSLPPAPPTRAPRWGMLPNPPPTRKKCRHRPHPTPETTHPVPDDTSQAKRQQDPQTTETDPTPKAPRQPASLSPFAPPTCPAWATSAPARTLARPLPLCNAGQKRMGFARYSDTVAFISFARRR
jgi:hypothetical protein